MCLFVDDSSIYTRVKNVQQSHEKLEKDLDMISKWAYQWKMVFNPDLSKQATEIIFSCKNNKPVHPNLTFNNIPVAVEPFTKHLSTRN